MDLSRGRGSERSAPLCPELRRQLAGWDGASVRPLHGETDLYAGRSIVPSTHCDSFVRRPVAVADDLESGKRLGRKDADKESRELPSPP